MQTEALLKVSEQLKEQLEAYNISLHSSTPIQYGRQLRLVAGDIWAEINIFHGKKGFSVVKTTKSGSNPELASLAKEVIEDILEI